MYNWTFPHERAAMLFFFSHFLLIGVKIQLYCVRSVHWKESRHRRERIRLKSKKETLIVRERVACCAASIVCNIALSKMQRLSAIVVKVIYKSCFKYSANSHPCFLHVYKYRAAARRFARVQFTPLPLRASLLPYLTAESPVSAKNALKITETRVVKGI